MKSNTAWAELDKLIAKDREPTGPEWFTCAEFAARYKTGRHVAKRRLAKLEAEGALESWHGTSPGVAGVFKKYRVKPKAPRAK